MKKTNIATVNPIAMASPSAAQNELMDPKTGQYTPRGLVAWTIASAEVSEMQCGMKGLITAALAKAARMGVPFDLNDKEDYSDVLFLGTELITKLKKENNVAAWCKDKVPGLVKLLHEP